MIINSKFNIPNIRELFRSLKNARAEWKQKTPMQKWCYFYSIGKGAFGVLRMPLMNDIYHVHWFAYFLLTYMTIVTLLSIYSLIYYTLRGELLMALPSTCTGFIMIGVSEKSAILLFTSTKMLDVRAVISALPFCIYVGLPRPHQIAIFDRFWRSIHLP